MTDGKLQEALEYAKKKGDTSLQRCLDRLKQTEENIRTNGCPHVNTDIYPDFAPLSFEFVRYEELEICTPYGVEHKKEFMSNGGIIYHGPHDDFGSGGSPTFSVCLEPTNGWSIHT